MSQNPPKWSLWGFSVLRHPNHLLLVGTNSRNVIITCWFLVAPVQATWNFSGILTVYFSLSTFLNIHASYKSASSGFRLLGKIAVGAKVQSQFSKIHDIKTLCGSFFIALTKFNLTLLIKIVNISAVGQCEQMCLWMVTCMIFFSKNN